MQNLGQRIDECGVIGVELKVDRLGPHSLDTEESGELAQSMTPLGTRIARRSSREERHYELGGLMEGHIRSEGVERGENKAGGTDGAAGDVDTCGCEPVDAAVSDLASHRRDAGGILLQPNHTQSWKVTYSATSPQVVECLRGRIHKRIRAT